MRRPSLPRRRPKYADVAATLALVLALGGTTAYAVQQLPKHSVGKQQIQRNAITSAKIKNGKVKGKDLADGSVGSAKLANASIGALDLATGSVTTSRLADSAVTGLKIANRSVSLDDLVGADVITNLAYSLANPFECATVTFTVPGASVDQAALMTYTGTTGSGNVSVSPLKVTGGQVSVDVCNIGTGPATANVPVRIVTLG